MEFTITLLIKLPKIHRKNKKLTQTHEEMGREAWQNTEGSTNLKCLYSNMEPLFFVKYLFPLNHFSLLEISSWTLFLWILCLKQKLTYHPGKWQREVFDPQWVNSLATSTSHYHRRNKGQLFTAMQRYCKIFFFYLLTHFTYTCSTVSQRTFQWKEISQMQSRCS